MSSSRKHSLFSVTSIVLVLLGFMAGIVVGNDDMRGQASGFFLASANAAAQAVVDVTTTK